MDPQEIFSRYGGWGLALLFGIPQMWKFVTEKVWPNLAQKNRRKEDRMDAESKAALDAERARLTQEAEDARAARDAEATLLKARIEREDRESEKRFKLEERTVTAIEQTQVSIASINQLMALVQQQLSQHHTFAFGAVGDIKTKLEVLEDAKEQRQRLDRVEENVKRITQDKIKTVGSSE